MEQKFGKITVETCEADGVEIEGLKVITPSVFGDDRGYLWRLTIIMICSGRH